MRLPKLQALHLLIEEKLLNENAFAPEYKELEKQYDSLLAQLRWQTVSTQAQILQIDNELSAIATQITEYRFNLSQKLTQFSQEEENIKKIESKLKELKAQQENFYLSGPHKYYAKAIYESPETLNFWFDFLDTDGVLNQFNVKAIGIRPKSINDSSIKSIYFRETPNVIFVENINVPNQLSGYKYIQIGKNNDSMFSISAQGKSAKDKLDELLYQHSYCIESATIVTIPIYYLQPNTRVRINDTETNINGDYIVSKLTIPLTYNGTMSITATKAAQNIL